MKNPKLLAVLSLTALLLGGCTPTEKESGTPAETGSDGELKGTLNMMYGCEEPYGEAVAKAFEKKYPGVTVHRIRKSAGEMQSTIETEKANPTYDVLFGGTTDPYNALKSNGLLEKYASTNGAKIDAKFRDADNYWYGIYQGILGFMWNTDKLTELGLTAPSSWDDLIKPEYSKYITWSHPETAGTAKLVINTIVQKKANGKKTTYKDEFGEDQECYDDTAAMEWFKQLDKNTAKYTKSGSGPSKEVGPGTTVIGIGFLHDVIYQIVDNEYKNIAMAVPSDGTSYEVGATAIVKGAKNLEIAKAFIEFATSPECVELGQENGSYQFLVAEGAKQPEVATQFGLDKAVLMDYDFDDAKNNISHYVEDWKTAVGVPAPEA